VLTGPAENRVAFVARGDVAAACPQPGLTQENPCPDCKKAQETQPADQTPQNEKACTSSDALSDVANCY
jgi:hypothetical protein